jgi:hypothetical protein
MVDLVRAGRSPEDLSRGFEPSGEAIRNWVSQADRDEGRRVAGPRSADVAEQLPRFIDEVYNVNRLHSALGYRSRVQLEEISDRQSVQFAAR